MSTVVGLDLGTSSFKLVELRKNGKGWAVVHVGIIPNPLGQLFVTTTRERTELAVAIKKLFVDSKASRKPVRIGLSETQATTRVLTLPAMNDAELSSAIRWEAEQQIPIPLASAQLDYMVLSRPEGRRREGTMDVLLVAAKKEAVTFLTDLVAEAGIGLISVETTMLGVGRGVEMDPAKATLLMHLGASSSDFSVMADGKPLLVYSVPSAGVSLTRSLEQTLELSVAQAEQYKRTYGLDEAQFSGRVRGALWPVFESILTEAKKIINAFESGPTAGARKIERVVLSGGTALLPGITRDVASSLGVSEAVVSAPFSNLTVDNHVQIPPEQAVFAAAVGLARYEP